MIIVRPDQKRHEGHVYRKRLKQMLLKCKNWRASVWLTNNITGITFNKSIWLGYSLGHTRAEMDAARLIKVESLFVRRKDTPFAANRLNSRSETKNPEANATGITLMRRSLALPASSWIEKIRKKNKLRMDEENCIYISVCILI